MRDRALVVMAWVCAAACGKVHNLADAGAIDATQFDASAGCATASCSASSDGCCPPVCNALDDPDCQPACGNGAIEAGETCDPLASCPTDCPAIGCQLRTLANPGTCAAACVDGAKITTCSETSDMCCPASCDASNDIDCAAVCGNNVVEPGETCDPLSTCPTSCPQQGCQLYQLFDAGTCQAQCVASGQQTACVNGDGCCPGGCNANNDSDCQPSCGNGVLEGNETCDPPASCTCAAEAYSCYGTTGSAATCDLVCHVPTTTCGIGGDGCCAFAVPPTGDCSAADDKECIGPGWKFVQVTQVQFLNGGCQTINVYGIDAGGAYDVTSCVQKGPAPNVDVYMKDITDSNGVTYPTGNDDCTDGNALPWAAGWTCKNVTGPQMFCASPSPGGFLVGKQPTFLQLTVCAKQQSDVIVPIFIWYNATQSPHLG
jgi:hypothetical protein